MKKTILFSLLLLTCLCLFSACGAESQETSGLEYELTDDEAVIKSYEDSIKVFELPIEKGDWGGFYDNVYDVLVNGKEQIVTHRQIRRVLSVIEAVFESAKNNEVVKVDL